MKINEVRKFNLNEKIAVEPRFSHISNMIKWRKTRPNADKINIEVWEQLLEYEGKKDIKYFFYLNHQAEPCLEIIEPKKARQILKLPKKGYQLTVSMIVNALFEEL